MVFNLCDNAVKYNREGGSVEITTGKRAGHPFLSVKAHKSVSDNRWLNLLIGIIVPAGLLIWLNIWRYRVRLDKDLKTIVKNNRDIQERIKTTF